MSTTVESIEEVPMADYYVICTDNFMSGWGSARNKKNICILLCDSHEEAKVVASNARGRSEMSDVITLNREELKRWFRHEGVMFSLFDREFADAWYEPGRWG